MTKCQSDKVTQLPSGQYVALSDHTRNPTCLVPMVNAVFIQDYGHIIYVMYMYHVKSDCSWLVAGIPNKQCQTTQYHG